MLDTGWALFFGSPKILKLILIFTYFQLKLSGQALNVPLIMCLYTKYFTLHDSGFLGVKLAVNTGLVQFKTSTNTQFRFGLQFLLKMHYGAPESMT